MKKPFERILIVMFENQYRSYVLQSKFMRKLASAGASMDNYFGAFHPSQTNYIASLAGEVCAVTNDTPPASPLMQQTLVDLLEPAGVSWKAYMEALPTDPHLLIPLSAVRSLSYVRPKVEHSLPKTISFSECQPHNKDHHFDRIR